MVCSVSVNNNVVNETVVEQASYQQKFMLCDCEIETSIHVSSQEALW